MAGIDAFGTQLLRGDGAEPEVFTAVANITNVGGPEIERATIDTTAHDSPDGWREFVGGLKDGGELSVEANYDPEQHDSLVVDFEDSSPRNYQIIWPGGAQWDCPLILTGFPPEAPIDDKLTVELTYQLAGKPTLTPAS